MGNQSSGYKEASEEYKNALDTYKQNLERYSGEQGYIRSLQQGQQAAGQAAQSTIGSSTAAARAQGLTKAQAALLAANAAQQAYGNQLQNQQQAASQAGQQAISGAEGLTSASGQRAQQQFQVGQQGYQNVLQGIGAAGQLAGGVGSMMMSDMRTKDFIPVQQGYQATGKDLTDMMTRYLRGHGESKFRPDSMFDPYQLAVGILVEQEHARNFDIAKEIAKDHLIEDPHYYSRYNFAKEAIEGIYKRVSDGGAKVAVDVSQFKLNLKGKE